MMYAAGEEEEGPRLKERIIDATYKGVDLFCVWDCCACYVRLSEVGRTRNFVSLTSVWDPGTPCCVQIF